MQLAVSAVWLFCPAPVHHSQVMVAAFADVWPSDRLTDIVVIHLACVLCCHDVSLSIDRLMGKNSKESQTILRASQKSRL